MSKDRRKKYLHHSPEDKKISAILSANHDLVPDDLSVEHNLLRSDLTKIIFLSGIFALVFIALYIYQVKTGNITEFSEYISGFIIK